MLMVLLPVVLSLWFDQMPDRAAEAKAIDVAKNAIVREIDQALPRMGLAQWLSSVCPGVETEWEVNDCGEQTGNPAVDRGRDFPMCVQADLALRKNRHLSLLLVVGTFKKGLTLGPPRFFNGSIVEGGIPTRRVEKLSDVPGVVRAAK